MQLNLGYLKFNNVKLFLAWNRFSLPEYSSELLNLCLPEVMKITKATDSFKTSIKKKKNQEKKITLITKTLNNFSQILWNKVPQLSLTPHFVTHSIFDMAGENLIAHIKKNSFWLVTFWCHSPYFALSIKKKSVWTLKFIQHWVKNVIKSLLETSSS